MPADKPSIPTDTWSVSEPLAPRVLGGRWQLELPPFDQGASGVVYRATDTHAGGSAAVKLLHPMSASQRGRVRREIAALRVLRLPGVVQLLDQGEDGEQHYIVMELVRGTPFPGAGVFASWETLAPSALALLQTLSRIHAAGVVHRDLKPANVLVEPSGRVVLLDFGLARGPALGGTITAMDQVVGTPRYLAPEQLDGQHADARADLYAVGVMLFEHLTGRLPHHAETVAELYAARLSREAMPVEHFAPDLPAPAVRLINELLRRSLQDRPRSATEAILLLGEARPRQATPRLGGGGTVDALLAAAREGHSISISGEAGIGRTRALRDATEVLRAEGRTVVWAVPGTRPFDSLKHVVDPPGESSDSPRRIETTLRALLGSGVVLVADDFQHVDRWSARLLDAVADAGTILVAGPEGVPILPLAEADLRAAFVGPDRLLHLPEDAARELYRRAGGVPGRVVAELDAWVAAGVATMSGDRFCVGRAGLEQLAGGLRVEPLLVDGRPRGALDSRQQDLLAWIALAFPQATVDVLRRASGMPVWELDLELAELEARAAVRRLPDGRWEPVAGTTAATSVWEEERRRAAHAAIASVLPEGADGRLAHLMGAGDLAAGAAESLLLARRLVQEGHLARALGVTEIGLFLTRQVGDVQAEEALLVEATIASVTSRSPESYARLRMDLDRSMATSALRAACDGILRAAVDAVNGRLADAAARVRGLDPLDQDSLEATRLTVLMESLRPYDAGAADAVIAAAASWAEGNGRRQGLHQMWVARQRYYEERYAEAATLHERAAALLHGADLLSASLGRAAALLDGFAFDEAIVVARHARTMAVSARLPHYEARAEWVLRSARYRKGEALDVDDEWVEVVANHMPPWLYAQILIPEAAIAWRRGDLERARDLAEQSRAAWRRAGFVSGETLMAALSLACRPAEDAPAVALAAAQCAVPGLALQALGLVAKAAPDLAASCLPAVEARVRAMPHRVRRLRLEILAPEEALSYCRDSVRRSP